MTETIGSILKRTREARNIAIADVVRVTRIRPHYIEALEADDFEILPSTAQARGFLRLYAEFLGYSLDEFSTLTGGESETPAADEEPDSSLSTAPDETPQQEVLEPGSTAAGEPEVTDEQAAPQSKSPIPVDAPPGLESWYSLIAAESGPESEPQSNLPEIVWQEPISEPPPTAGPTPVGRESEKKSATGTSPTRTRGTTSAPATKAAGKKTATTSRTKAASSAESKKTPASSRPAAPRAKAAGKKTAATSGTKAASSAESKKTPASSRPAASRAPSKVKPGAKKASQTTPASTSRAKTAAKPTAGKKATTIPSQTKAATKTRAETKKTPAAATAKTAAATTASKAGKAASKPTQPAVHKKTVATGTPEPARARATSAKAPPVSQRRKTVERTPPTHGEPPPETKIPPGPLAVEAQPEAIQPTMVETDILSIPTSPPIELEPGPSTDDSAPVEEPVLEQSGPPPPPPAQISADIYTAIGVELRQRRELLSLNLDEIERHTHVRRQHLEAIEAGDFDGLPSPVQTRGMLYNYAGFLDLDTDVILLRFADGLQLQRLERQSSEQGKTSPSRKKRRSILPPAIRRSLSADLIVFLLVAGILIAFIIWGISSVFAQPAEPTSQPPPISDVLSTTPTPQTAGEALPIEAPVTATAAVQEVAEAPEEIFPAAVEGSIQIAVFATERTWMRVVVDGDVAFEGRTTAGAVYEFAGGQLIEIVTGNAAALRITYQGNDLGPLGAFGQAVDRIYTISGILEPTSTPVPTPTITPTPTRTPRPSATPRISPTPPP